MQKNYNLYNSSKLIFSISLLSISLLGCLRGETKSLTEVYNIAKQRFSDVSKEGIPGNISTSISAVTTSLDNLVNASGNSKDVLSKIEVELSTLLPLAGYPVRPAFTEVRNQFLEVSQVGSVSEAEAKLLAFRTYNVLTEELKGSKFQIYNVSN